jgi:cytochrome c-type biogenesis protein CcmH/NrfG
MKTERARDQTSATIIAYVGRAQSLREQGNYAAALAELEKARVLDPPNESVRKAIEQTKRACNAERVLGNPVTC